MASTKAQSKPQPLDPALLPAPETPEGRLLQAIAQNDLTGFRQALAEKPEVNCDGGKPLQYAALIDNRLFMKDLILRGADVPHAVNELKKERDAIPRKRNYDHWGDSIGYTYRNKAEKARYAEITRQIKTLDDYQKVFLDTVRKLESVQLQFRTLQELQELKAEILEALHGKPLQKNPLAAPAAFRAPGLPKPGREGGA